jgi:hypothetical protein
MAKQKRASLRALIAPPAPSASAPEPAPAAIYQLSTNVPPEELPAAAGELGPELLELARRYIGARRRSGEALLEAARWLSEARELAGRGSWYTFLQVTATSEDLAERLLNIQRLAARSPAFEAAVVQGRLNQSVAALLARPSTPPEVLETVLAEPSPNVGLVQRTLRAVRQGEQIGDHAERVETPQIAGLAELEDRPAEAQLLSPAALEAIARLTAQLGDVETPQIAGLAELEDRPAEAQLLSPAALEAIARLTAQLGDLVAQRARRGPAEHAALRPLASALRALLDDQLGPE